MLTVFRATMIVDFVDGTSTTFQDVRIVAPNILDVTTKAPEVILARYNHKAHVALAVRFNDVGHDGNEKVEALILDDETALGMAHSQVWWDEVRVCLAGKGIATGKVDSLIEEWKVKLQPAGNTYYQQAPQLVADAIFKLII